MNIFNYYNVPVKQPWKHDASPILQSLAMDKQVLQVSRVNPTPHSKRQQPKKSSWKQVDDIHVSVHPAHVGVGYFIITNMKLCIQSLLLLLLIILKKKLFFNEKKKKNK